MLVLESAKFFENGNCRTLRLFPACAFFPSQSFASERKNVRVGYYEAGNFQTGADINLPKSGYSYEYLRKLQSYTDWKYDYVYGDFAELYEKLVSGEIDVLTGLDRKKETKNGQVGFADLPMGSTMYTFLKRDEDDDITPNPTTFDGKSLGVLKGKMQEIVESYEKTHRIKLRIVVFADLPSRNRALVNKDVDLVIVESVATTIAEGIEPFEDAGVDEYFVGTSLKRPDLLEDLNRAQAQMFEANPNLKTEMGEEYFHTNLTEVELSPAEQEWAKKYKTLTVGYFDQYLPYSSTGKNGRVDGVVEEIVPELFRMLYIRDVQIQYKSFATYKEMREALRKGEVDAYFPTLSDFWTLEEYDLMPTKSIISSFFNFVYVGKPPQLMTAKIAVQKNNAVDREFRRLKYPHSHEILCETVEACLDSVIEKKGRCDISQRTSIRLLSAS